MIKVVTDSTANLSRELQEKYNISVLSSSIIFEKPYREGLDLTYEELWVKLKTAKEIPMTVPPTAAEFSKLYLDLAKDTQAIFSVHISSQLSNIYRNASIAADTLKKQNVKTEIIVIDTQMVDMGLGMVVLEAAKAAQEGKNKEFIQNVIKTTVGKMHGYIYVDNLEFLIKGGRVSKLQGVFATLLNMKPILTIENGQILSKERVTSREKGMEKILSLIESEVGLRGSIKAGVIDSLAKQEGDNLLLRVREKFNCLGFYRRSCSPTVSVHTGPGAVGVFYYKP